MLFTALTLLGVISYKQLPVELYPNTQIPYLFVQVGTPMDVDSKYMESQAIIPLEGAISTLKGVDKIESTIDEQRGMIQISYGSGTSLKYAYLKLLEKVEEAKKKIPADFYVQVYKFDLEQLNNSLMKLQVRGSGGVDRIRQVVNNSITNRLQNVNGVANVAVFGGREKSVEIILNEAICKAFNISPSDIRTALNNNSRARTFAGKVTENNQFIFINVVSEFTDINEIQNLVVKEPGSVKLRDIAEVRFGVKEEESYSRVNGKEAVTVELTRDTQSNMIELSHKVRDQIDILNKELKTKDVEIVIQDDSAEMMEKNIDLIIQLALIGGLLAIFVLWIFLKNIRLVVAIGLAIPISVYTAFNLFYAFGISINSLTLIGMSLAIGMLLDNSVVVMENIYRLASKGIDVDTAVTQGVKEVWRSITAATLTTVVIFLPFAFSKNFLVEVLGKHIGVSIISTLIISLVVALMLVPMITHSFMKLQQKTNAFHFESISFHNRLIQIYRVLLKSGMRFPARTVIGALGVFFLTLIISLGVSMVSNNEPEIETLTLYATMPGGTTLDKTDKQIAEIEKILVKLPEKKDVISQVYMEEAVITIELQKEYKKIRHNSVPQIKKEILKSLSEFDGISFSWEATGSNRRFGGASDGGSDNGFMDMMGMGGNQESIIIKGENFDQMVAQANQVKYYLSQQSSIQVVTVNIPSARPEVLMNFDKQLMAEYEIAPSTVLSELNSMPREFSSGVKFKQGTDVYDIQILTPQISNEKEKDRNLDDLKKLPVKGARSSQFELQNIAGFNFGNGNVSIKRTNQAKQLEVTYSFIEEVLDDKRLLEASRAEVDELVQKINFPTGITMEVKHETQDLSDFTFLFLAAFILIYMILASIFESFSTPIVLMFAIPLAGIGSLVALILTGNSLLNINTLTGFIILIGIVVNNSIILIDYSNVLQKRGYRRSRSLIMAGIARVRPILITSITTVIALIPLAMGRAEYVTEIGAPFAVTVIGGLGLSTLLTLVFIPTLHMGLHTALRWIYDQKIITKTGMLLAYCIGFYFIYTEIDSTVWQIICYFLVIILTPASIFFVQKSLRQANEKLIADDTPLHITVRNLVKIYDRESRFSREWQSGKKIRQRSGMESKLTTWRDFDYLVWQAPLVGFCIYFIYFYIQGGFWSFVLPWFLYLLIVSVVSPIREFAGRLHAQKSIKWPKWIVEFVYKLIFWGFPAIALFLFKLKFGLIGLIIPFLILWYLLILIKVTSDKLYNEKINVNRLTGRFKGIRKVFYRFVMVIPVIGKKKVPFKALRGVSFEIENGMFGLLGPNGAGKSTLMRIVCGILEPSYGQITINGIDVKEKREELQGLIGYLPQEFGMYENLTAWDFLNYMGILKKLYNPELREQRINYVLEAVHMTEHKNEKIGSFSGGMKQRIGIAQILMHLPRILVVDEPTAGLDPRERIRFRNLLVELSKERIVIFSTHIIEDVASSCNKVAVVKNGEIKYLGEPIQMAQTAEGKIWMADMSIEAFETFKDKFVIIHHMRDGDNIRVRCMANDCPHQNARQVKANLEDAYLFLLQ